MAVALEFKCDLRRTLITSSLYHLLGERLRIGDDVTATVLSVKCNQVRMGIDAPRNIGIIRERIAERNPRGALSRRRRHSGSLRSRVTANAWAHLASGRPLLAAGKRLLLL